jgi:PAS domain S-box-containing protein
MPTADLHSLLSEILATARAITGADMGNIQLMEGGSLRIAAQHGFEAEFLDFFAEVHNPEGASCGAAMVTGEQTVVEDVEQSPIFAGTPALQILRNAGVAAVQSTPMFGSSGTLVGMLSTHYRQAHLPNERDLQLLGLFARQAADLIEKTRAEEALRESEERYRATFDNAAVGIAHVGLDGRWIRFNEAVCAITGYSREELSAKTFGEITHPDDLDADWLQARRAASGEIPSYSMEKRYVRKNGSIVWVNLTVSMQRDGSGAPRHYVSIIEDISERKRAEAELRGANEQLQLVTDNMPIGVSRCSRDLRYVWVSRAYAGWLGRQPEEIAGQPIVSIIGERGFEDIGPYVARVLAGEKVEYRKEVNYRETGPRWVHAVYVPTYSGAGEVDGWIAVVTDITEDKRAAEQQRQSQRLESLGVLAGGIAHDFNNLLVGILGNASLTMDMIGAASSARPLLEELIKASERAASLTQQLLAYAGKERIATRPLHLQELIRELTGLLRASIPKNVRLVLDIPESLPPVEADHTQMQQVIMNLVINAAEAIPENRPGTVKISAAARQATAADHAGAVTPLPSASESYVAVTVSDTGQGMTPEVRSRMFDPFFTTKFMGRGLGLAAVLGIVQAHRGAITIKTAPGDGTAITLLFPPTAATARADSPASAVLGQGEGTVLFVDDEEPVRTVARRALEHHGYRVLLAESGQQAIETLREHPEVIAIVLDLAMPDMTGDQAAPLIREIDPTVPIILSSGYAEREARSKFGEVGLAGFLQKPYRAGALVEMVNAYGGRASSPRGTSVPPGGRTGGPQAGLKPRAG